MDRNRSLAAVVMIVQDVTASPSGLRHLSHRPAKGKVCPEAILIRTGRLPAAVRRHSKNPQASIRQRRLLSVVRKLGFSATVSTRALIMRLPIEASFAQDGIKPQRKGTPRRARSCSPTVSTLWVSAML